MEEKNALVQQIHNLKLEKAELTRLGFQTTEDVMEKLNEALQEIQVLKNLNGELSRENKILHEDKSAQEDLAAQAKTYSQLLECMLDQARDDPTFRPSSDKTEEMEKMQKEIDRLQREKEELADMMEEFKAMWSKDSKNFQETLKTVKEEGKALQQEVTRLEGMRAEAESAFIECYTMKETEMRDHAITKDDYRQLKASYEKLQTDLEECQNELQTLHDANDKEKEAHEETKTLIEKLNEDLYAAEEYLETLQEEKKNADTKLNEQATWIENRAVDHASAVRELFECKERTAREIQDIHECSRVKQDAYEQELAEIKKRGAEEKANLSGQLQRAESELEVLRYEHNYTVPALKEELAILQSESLFNHSRYAALQDQAASFEKALKQSQDNRARESETYAATMDGVVSQLNECKAALASTMADNNQIRTTLQSSEEKVWDLQSELSSVKSNFIELQGDLASSEHEVELLREQLAATLRETVVQRDRMEQKSEDSIAAMKKQFSQKIEEVKHNNMLAINQEMIKAQMALDSEKKKSALEYCDLAKKLEAAVCAHETTKQQSSNKISFLSQEMVTLRNHNVTLRRELQTTQARDQAIIAKLKSDVKKLEESATDTVELHESQVNQLMEEHRKRLENMGVEELDDENEVVEPTEVREQNDSAEWEVVDEEE